MVMVINGLFALGDLQVERLLHLTDAVLEKGLLEALVEQCGNRIFAAPNRPPQSYGWDQLL